MSKVSNVISSRQGREIRGDYNEISVFELAEVKQAKLEMWIAKNVGEAVAKIYPNRQWGVVVDIDNQVVILKCESISNRKGYYINLLGRTIDDLQKRAIQAAGEVLEMHGVERTKKFDESKLETLPRNIRDDVVTADSAAPEEKGEEDHTVVTTDSSTIDAFRSESN